MAVFAFFDQRCTPREKHGPRVGVSIGSGLLASICSAAGSGKLVFRVRGSGEVKLWESEGRTMLF